MGEPMGSEQPVRELEVPCQVQLLRVSIELLADEINNLEGLLSGVIRPPEPPVAKEPEKLRLNPITKLGEDLDGLTCRLLQLKDNVKSLANRVEV